jgi:inner membrane protein
MTTIFTHAIAGVTIGSTFKRSVLPRSLWVCGAICAVIPDGDVIGLRFGVAYDSFWGHRGFTHSLLFAACLALLLTFTVFFSRAHKLAIAAYLFLATASHGLLDARTDGGLGVAFFSPFDNDRFFFPWNPIHVSPIGIRFFSPRALEVLLSEFVWVVLPCCVVFILAYVIHRDHKPKEVLP